MTSGWPPMVSSWGLPSSNQMVRSSPLGCHFLTPPKGIQLFLLVKCSVLPRPARVSHWAVSVREWMSNSHQAANTCPAPGRDAGCAGTPQKTRPPQRCPGPETTEKTPGKKPFFSIQKPSARIQPPPWKRGRAHFVCSELTSPIKHFHSSPLGTEPICPTVSEITPDGQQKSVDCHRHIGTAGSPHGPL